jgi:ribosomal protein L36
MKIRTGLKKSDIPPENRRGGRNNSRRNTILDFLESCDEAWEIVPEDEIVQSLYSAFVASVRTDKTFIRNCYAVRRGDRIFLVRY